MDERFSRIEKNTDLYIENDHKSDIIDILLYSLMIGIFVLLILFTSIIDVKAETISVNLTSNGVSAGQNCINHPLNAFCTSQMVQGSSSNACGNGDSKCNMYMAYGTENNVYSLNFVVNTSFHANSKVTITLKGPYFANATYGCTTNVGTANNLGCRAIRTSSTSMNINFTTNSNPLTYADFDVYIDSGNGFNPNKFFNITSVVLYETPIEDSSSSSFDDSGIINNANQNTSDIIQNADSNAHDTQNVIIAMNEKIMNEISNKCPNLFNPNNSGYDSFGKYYVDLSNLVNGYTYTISTNNKVYVYKFSSFNNVDYGQGVGPEMWDPNGAYSWTFTYTGHQRLFFNVTDATANYFVNDSSELNGFQFMLVSGNVSKPYCSYGSYFSKLDDINDELGGIYGGIQSTNDKVDTTNDKLDDINDSITSDNVDSDVGSDFFDDFSEDDPGGISGIITRPLIIINSLLDNNGRCDNLSLPTFMGVSDAYLPSGCVFWNRVSTAGVTLWNIFLCGACSYVILIDLFRLVENLKSPTHNKIEVLDL